MKEYILTAKTDPGIIRKQRVDNEKTVTGDLCEVFLSEDIGLRVGDKVKVTLEKIEEEKK